MSKRARKRAMRYDPLHISWPLWIVSVSAIIFLIAPVLLLIPMSLGSAEIIEFPSSFLFYELRIIALESPVTEFTICRQLVVQEHLFCRSRRISGDCLCCASTLFRRTKASA